MPMEALNPKPKISSMLLLILWASLFTEALALSLEVLR